MSFSGAGSPSYSTLILQWLGRLCNIQLKTHDPAGDTGIENSNASGCFKGLWALRTVWDWEERMPGFAWVLNVVKISHKRQHSSWEMKMILLGERNKVL